MHFWKNIGQVGFKISHEANKGEQKTLHSTLEIPRIIVLHK
jgi:hypothetical protein